MTETDSYVVQTFARQSSIVRRKVSQFCLLSLYTWLSLSLSDTVTCWESHIRLVNHGYRNYKQLKESAWIPKHHFLPLNYLPRHATTPCALSPNPSNFPLSFFPCVPPFFAWAPTFVPRRIFQPSVTFQIRFLRSRVYFTAHIANPLGATGCLNP